MMATSPCFGDDDSDVELDVVADDNISLLNLQAQIIECLIERYPFLGSHLISDSMNPDSRGGNDEVVGTNQLTVVLRFR